MKIYTRLLLLFLVVSVLPLALFSYFNLQQDEVAMRLAELDEMSNLAGKKAGQIQSYLAERRQDVRFLARGTQVMGAIGMMQEENAVIRHNTAPISKEAMLHQYFKRYIEETGLFYDAFLINPHGDIIFSHKHEADFATNLMDGPFRDTQLAQAFRATSMTLEPVISGYEYYAPSRAPALFIAAPVMIDGKFRGAFAVQLGNELFYRVATDATGLGQSGEVTFAQRDGEGVLYTTPLRYRPDAAMKFRLGLSEIKSLPMAGALVGNSGSGTGTDYRGKEVVAAWRYLPELGWGMEVKLDTDEAFASIYQQRTLMLEVLAGLVMFTGLLAYYSGRRISVPLKELARTADEVAKGNLDWRADESAFGELGMLAHAFNHMAGNLQELYRTLEERIEERTCELKASNEHLQEEIAVRGHIESVLREKEHLLSESQRIAHVGSWRYELTGQLTWSDETYHIFGGSPDNFTPSVESLLNLIHPDDRPGMQAWIAACAAGEKPGELEFRINRPDGTARILRGFGELQYDAGNRPRNLMGIVYDITERKQTEEALRVAAVTFESHDAILITDANANIIRVNQAFQDTTGYGAEEVLGKNPRILSSGRQDKAFYEEMWRQLLATGSWTGEMWDRRKGGQVYPKWLTITAVKDGQGRTTEYVGIFSDISALKQAEEEIRNLAFYDALTKLPNRRLLLDRFRLALPGSVRSHHYGAVLFLDMDRFKTLNDTLGHEYGDLLLIEVAKRIQSCVREADTVARLGGDEFVVLIEEVSANVEEALQRVALIAEKIRAILAAPYQLKEHEYHSSPSIGVCLYRGSEESVDVLLKHADLAMYQAKDSGRNAVRFFDPSMQHAVELHAALEVDLRRALPNRELRLYYQIQVDSEHRPLGAEALVRWLHPKRGMVSPTQFIPIAEESSLILDIGHWVMETACRQLAVWGKRERTRHLELAVNVSAQQFRKHDFVETVAAMIRAHQLDPACLKLELTESVVLADVSDVVAKMHALKALGIKLALDDFGTGYSSLSCLKQLPLDQIKIDQSFVRDIATDPNDAVMVKTIIDMAQNFRLNVIAEGVETELQLEFLKQNGCMAYQGYLFGKPVPIEQLETLLSEQMQ
ncbi:MAG TPA: EAL domain-containing protein [Gallionella sp.]|nr:EAL domain-containing protein [Gallionella sp.]